MIAAALLVCAVVVMARELRAARAASSDFARLARREHEAAARVLAAEGEANRRLLVVLETHRLTAMANRHLSAWADETPQAWTTDPKQERIRLAHSAVWAAKNLTQESAEALRS